ncbi:hypothetical protein [Bradyrhizobium liaoningense]|uniref:hypothetical protein n=1 Tax=Bradyrhizobium liaoningense TaxID=43992 RepID=UPI001BAA5DB5|nr:hypothetical protein [Bradyrhizobium liaoningense]MBR0857996.1 hypothetical protein [Bradyrhizobium liaoningense]
MDLTVSLHRPRSRRQPDKPDMRKTVDRNFTGAAAGSNRTGGGGCARFTLKRRRISPRSCSCMLPA